MFARGLMKHLCKANGLPVPEPPSVELPWIPKEEPEPVDATRPVPAGGPIRDDEVTG